MPLQAVATDFSTRSDRALRRAVLLASVAEGELLLIHVIDEDQPERMIRAQQEQADCLLLELQATLGEVDGVRTQSAVRIGQADEEIPRAALEAGADLIVMGPHRRRISDLIGGTTLQRTIARSSLPVLVANGVPASRYRRVLLATTLEPTSAQVLTRAVALPYLQSCKGTLLYVYDSLARDVQARSLMSNEDDEAEIADEMVQEHARLQEFASQHGLEGHRLRVRCNSGSVGGQIIATAGQEEADLVVVGRSTKGIIEATIVGRASDTVLNEADLDVLVLPGSK
jgi:nucleotide-binding universal stress UspA family protein